MLLFCRGKVTVVEEHLKHHKHVQKMYEDLLADVPGVKVHSQPSLPPVPPSKGKGEVPVFDSNYWLCTITIDPEVKVKGQEDAYKTIVTGAECLTYDTSVAYVNGVSEAIFKVGMCLPAGPYVTDDDVKYIVETIRENIIG